MMNLSASHFTVALMYTVTDVGLKLMHSEPSPQRHSSTQCCTQLR